MESLDLVLNGKSLDDIMYQRMKNRERQRRYRERKRLQAENLNRSSSKSAPPANPPAEPSLKRTTNQHITRVHCTRDWKKDARRAHAIKQEVLGLLCLVWMLLRRIGLRLDEGTGKQRRETRNYDNYCCYELLLNEVIA
ncbi:hypothetical protein Droror1_Dr00025502 [Drosera rotundifolia]